MAVETYTPDLILNAKGSVVAPVNATGPFVVGQVLGMHLTSDDVYAARTLVGTGRDTFGLAVALVAVADASTASVPAVIGGGVKRAGLVDAGTDVETYLALRAQGITPY